MILSFSFTLPILRSWNLPICLWNLHWIPILPYSLCFLSLGHNYFSPTSQQYPLNQPLSLQALLLSMYCERIALKLCGKYKSDQTWTQAYHHQSSSLIRSIFFSFSNNACFLSLEIPHTVASAWFSFSRPLSFPAISSENTPKAQTEDHVFRKVSRFLSQGSMHLPHGFQR